MKMSAASDVIVTSRRADINRQCAVTERGSNCLCWGDLDDTLNSSFDFQAGNDEAFLIIVRTLRPVLCEEYDRILSAADYRREANSQPEFSSF
jgi:hypothetical protein